MKLSTEKLYQKVKAEEPDAGLSRMRDECLTNIGCQTSLWHNPIKRRLAFNSLYAL